MKETSKVRAIAVQGVVGKSVEVRLVKFAGRIRWLGMKWRSGRMEGKEREGVC